MTSSSDWSRNAASRSLAHPYMYLNQMERLDGALFRNRFSKNYLWKVLFMTDFGTCLQLFQSNSSGKKSTVGLSQVLVGDSVVSLVVVAGMPL